MRRRLAAVSGLLAIALLFPASAAADSLFPQTGRYAEFSGGACDLDGFCTGVNISITDMHKNFGMCIEIRHASEGIEYEREYGCWDDGDLLGELVYSNKLIVGIGESTVRVLSDLTNDSRLVTFSVDTAISTNISITNEGGTLADTPSPGCTTTWSGRLITADSSGRTTMGGDDLSTIGILETWQTKGRTRC